MPVVSVLMSVYNAERYLAQAVESILEQNLADFELLALDDASTDGSAEYLDGLTDSRVRVFHLPKQGLTRSLNQGLRDARGAYIARMDADDVALPARLECQWRFLEAHPEVVAVGCQADQIDADGRSIEPWGFPVDDAAIRYALFRNLAPLLHPGVMMRRSALEAIGGYDERFETAQDRDLWWRLAVRGRLANVPETLMRYRRHAGAVTGARTEFQLATARRINLEHMTSLGVVENETEYDLFQQVALALLRGMDEAIDPAIMAVYARVHSRVVAYLRHQGGDVGVVDTLERESWWRVSNTALAEFDRRRWREWLPALWHAAPGPGKVLRMSRWAGRLMRRRLGKHWRKLRAYDGGSRAA